MRDFDEQRAARTEQDQGFKLGGEAFRIFTGVHPSVLHDYELAVPKGRGDLLSAMDTAIKAFLATDDERKRWDALRARKKDPVTVGDLRAVIDFLYEAEADLPTIAPGPSSTGRGRSRRSSEAGTSSPAGTES